jgi:hypothetical protein
LNGDSYQEGLFTGKVNETTFNVERFGFVDAAAGLYITGLFFGFTLPMMINIVRFKRLSLNAYKFGLFAISFATLLDLIGVALYQSNLDNGYPGSNQAWNSNSSTKIGYGLIAPWVTFCSNFVCTCFTGLLVSKIKEWQS